MYITWKKQVNNTADCDKVALEVSDSDKVFLDASDV